MKRYFNSISKHLYFVIITLFILLLSCSNAEKSSNGFETSNQMILVITDSVTATNGYLYSFERKNADLEWTQRSKPIKIVLGRNGLGLGIGLHNLSDLPNIPTKMEGDGRSPAGIFTLSAVFGYKSAEQMPELRMPYIHITEMIECIDDSASKFYNKFVTRDKIEAINGVDWKSSEKMSEAGVYYELGVVVDHNSNIVKKGAGSCIFLHNWADSTETMAGCTAMAPEKMKEIAFWLNKSQNPLLVQLTKQLYLDLSPKWNLPEIYGNK